MNKGYLEFMVRELTASLNNVTANGDENSRKAIEIQISIYKRKLAEIK